MIQLADLPAFGAPVTLRWRKRCWLCRPGEDNDSGESAEDDDDDDQLDEREALRAA